MPREKSDSYNPSDVQTQEFSHGHDYHSIVTTLLKSSEERIRVSSVNDTLGKNDNEQKLLRPKLSQSMSSRFSSGYSSNVISLSFLNDVRLFADSFLVLSNPPVLGDSTV
jgi:hypothetical protein